MVRVACSALDVFSITNRHQLFFFAPPPPPCMDRPRPMCALYVVVCVPPLRAKCGRGAVLGECMCGAAFQTRGGFTIFGASFFFPLPSFAMFPHVPWVGEFCLPLVQTAQGTVPSPTAAAPPRFLFIFLLVDELAWVGLGLAAWPGLGWVRLGVLGVPALCLFLATNTTCDVLRAANGLPLLRFLAPGCSCLVFRSTLCVVVIAGLVHDALQASGRAPTPVAKGSHSMSSGTQSSCGRTLV
jgi:hypothetical protein